MFEELTNRIMSNIPTAEQYSCATTKHNKACQGRANQRACLIIGNNMFRNTTLLMDHYVVKPQISYVLCQPLANATRASQTWHRKLVVLRPTAMVMVMLMLMTVV